MIFSLKVLLCPSRLNTIVALKAIRRVNKLAAMALFLVEPISRAVAFTLTTTTRTLAAVGESRQERYYSRFQLPTNKWPFQDQNKSYDFFE